MNAAVITAQSADIPANIRFATDWPEPGAPGPGQVLIKTLCSSLNHLDLWVAKGVPGLKLTYPRISGSDACGVVTAVGPGVDPSWLNKRVILNAAVLVPPSPKPLDPPEPDLPDISMIGEHTQGTNASAFLAPVTNVQALADDADPALAAAFGLTFLTAYSMLVTKANVKPGQWVLITGIGGGVAGAALQICKHLGARTIVTSRHQRKLDAAKSLGADAGVLDTSATNPDPKAGDWSRAVRQLTGNRGVDIAIDSSGKATHLMCIKSLARGGTYATPGCTSGPDATTDLARIFWNQLRIVGSTMGSNDDFASLATLFNRGTLRPTIDKVFPASEAPAAYARLASGEQMGKIVLDWR
ncbi:MAG: zinc-binding dehydrogenase [Phycisphaerales bacterium]|nr:zinc-binding dehydrogenase [Phycisphaerales bacterium]